MSVPEIARTVRTNIRSGKANNMLKIAVIVGSVRKNRFCDKPAKWILGELQKRDNVHAELLDLVDYPMPFFDETVGPSMKKAPYENEVVERWTAKIGSSDGFVIVTPEYNHSTSAVLKNALDYVYREWHRKAVGFVSYGGSGGARAVEHLRGIAVELQMAPIRSALHIPMDTLMAYFQGKPLEEKWAAAEPHATTLINDLLWWTGALKTARQT